MSMLSAQCKKLRIMSGCMYTLGYENVAREMRDAADAIDELRLRLQETCHNVHGDSVEDLAVWFTCSECGVTYIENAYSHYCCNCGRRIVG